MGTNLDDPAAVKGRMFCGFRLKERSSSCSGFAKFLIYSTPN